MEYFKAFLEALNLNMKSRFNGFVFGLALLLLKPVLKSYNMEWFYSHFSWMIVLITVFFGATLSVDFWGFCKAKFTSRSLLKNFDNYVCNLSGRKLSIVKEIYIGVGHCARFRIGDTDVRELVERGVIGPATNHYAVFPNEENLSNPPIYFMLQPRTLQLIEQNEQLFDKLNSLN